MTRFKVYPDPKLFLEAAGPFLEEQEAENNLILGNCYNIVLENRSYADCYFMRVGSENQILASSVKVSPKIVISGGDVNAIKEILGFYENNAIQYTGVIGDTFSSELFAKLSGKKILQRRITLIQTLDKTKELHIKSGSMILSRTLDLDLLSIWIGLFFEEEHLYPKRSREQRKSYINNLIEQGNLFLWIVDGKPVSMAAIIRKTRNMAIIGLVYTPPENRGKGFAKNCTHQLTEHILKSGFKQSGLLVFDKNETAKKIYRDIGYSPVSEVMDIDFE